MRSLVVALLVGCGGAASPPPPRPVAPAPPPAPVVEAPVWTPPPAAPIAEAELELDALVKSPEIREAVDARAAGALDVAALRDHALAPRIREIVDALAPGIDLFGDVDAAFFVAPNFVHVDRGIVVVRPRAGVDVIWYFERIARASSFARETDIGVAGTRAWRMPDRPDRLMMRVRNDLVVVTAEKHAPMAARTFARHAPKRPPAKTILQLLETGAPPQLSSAVPAARDVIESRASVDAVEKTKLGFHFAWRCADDARAAELATGITEWLKRSNSVALRLATRGLLNRARATSDGATAKLDIVADERQTAAVVELVASLTGAPATP